MTLPLAEARARRDELFAEQRAREGKPTARERAFALGRRRKPGEMNGQEQEYAAHLDQRKAAGEILWWKFQGIKFRLADNSFYTPDFNVMTAECALEMHEFKGSFWMDDARVKIKVAADQYPMRFIAVRKRAKKNGGGWDTEEF